LTTNLFSNNIKLWEKWSRRFWSRRIREFCKWQGEYWTFDWHWH